MDKEMVEKFEYKGYWFLPNNTENAIAGTLTFMPNEKMELEIIGSIENKDSSIGNFLNKNTLSIIHGITSDSQKVTLFNCYPFGKLNLSCSFAITKYSCQYLIIGKHLNDIQENCFNKIQIHVPLLAEWLYPAAIKTIVEFNNKDKAESISYTISANQKDKIKCKVDIDSQFLLTIKSGIDLNESEDRLNITLSQLSYFEIECISDKTSINNLLTRADLFLQFISLASLSPTGSSSIILYDNDNFQDIGDDEKLINPIKLYRKSRNEKIKKIKIFDFLFTHSDIEKVFSDIMIKWFHIKSDMAPIREHLIKSVQEKGYFDSLDFLIIVQALEGYHRRFIDRKRTKLLERLKELLVKFEDIDKIKKLDIDMDVVVQSRDYYSHFFDKSEKPLLLDGIELYRLSNKLRLLLICCVLNLIGIDNDTINNLFKNSNSRKLQSQ